MGKKDYDRCIGDATKAIQLDPTRSRYYNLRGLAWSLKKHDDTAIRDDKAITFDSQNALAHTNRGISWLAKQEYDKGIADFDEALRLNPNDALALDCRDKAIDLRSEQRAVENAQREVQVIKGLWQRHRYEFFVFGGKAYRVNAGAFSWTLQRLRVMQIVDGRNMLAVLRLDASGEETWWIGGISTAGMVDGENYNIVPPVDVVTIGTKTYATAAGGSRTVRLAVGRETVERGVSFEEFRRYGLANVVR